MSLIPTSLLIETVQFLTSQGWKHYLYCGLTRLWAYCSVCQAYSQHTPFTKQYDYKYVCDTCHSYSKKVYHKELQ